MHWKKKIKIEPEIGDRKLRIKFAWLPVELDSNDSKEVIWLEFYYEEKKFLRCNPSAIPGLTFAAWKVTSRTQDPRKPYY